MRHRKNTKSKLTKTILKVKLQRYPKIKTETETEKYNSLCVHIFSDEEGDIKQLRI